MEFAEGSTILPGLATGPFRPGGGGFLQLALKMEFGRGEAALRSMAVLCRTSKNIRRTRRPRRTMSSTGISPRGAASPPEPRRGRAAGLASQATRKQSARGRRRGPPGEIPQEKSRVSPGIRAGCPRRSARSSSRFGLPHPRATPRFAGVGARPPASLRNRRFGRRSGRRRGDVGNPSYRHVTNVQKPHPCHPRFVSKHQ